MVLRFVAISSKKAPSKKIQRFCIKINKYKYTLKNLSVDVFSNAVLIVDTVNRQIL